MKRELFKTMLTNKYNLKNALCEKEMLNLKKKNIMVIDDCKDTLKAIQYSLKNQTKFVTNTYDNEFFALSQFMRDRPDLVILDVNLAKLDGLKVSAIFKNLSMFSVPIIFISQDANVKEEIKMAHGKDAIFLSKPINNEELINKISDLIGF